MAQNIKLWGSTLNDVPAILVPKSTSGTARFTDASVTTATESDVASGKIFIKADGSQATGTNSGGGGGATQNIYCGSSAPSSSLGSNGDIYLLLASGGSVELYPDNYTKSNMNSSSSALGNCIGVSAANGNSTSNVYSSGSGVTGTADYTFDFSDIPSDATITSVSLQVKAHEENASRSECTVQCYAGSTAKGSLTTVNGTSNALYTVDVGSWTRSELDTFKMRLSLGYYGGLIAGATLVVNYDMADPSYSVTLTGDASGWGISGANIYKKTNGSWSVVSSAALDDTIGRS